MSTFSQRFFFISLHTLKIFLGFCREMGGEGDWRLNTVKWDIYTALNTVEWKNPEKISFSIWQETEIGFSSCPASRIGYLPALSCPQCYNYCCGLSSQLRVSLTLVDTFSFSSSNFGRDLHTFQGIVWHWWIYRSSIENVAQAFWMLRGLFDTRYIVWGVRRQYFIFKVQHVQVRFGKVFALSFFVSFVQVIYCGM